MKPLSILRFVIPVLLIAATATAQNTATKSADAAKPSDNPLSAYTKHVYDGVQSVLLRSAEKMPEENYSFKPADTVRSYGQILGHIADAQYLFCSVALGEKNPGLKIEQTKTSKADLIAALKDAFAYCNKAYDSMSLTIPLLSHTTKGPNTFRNRSCQKKKAERNPIRPSPENL